MKTINCAPLDEVWCTLPIRTGAGKAIRNANPGISFNVDFAAGAPSVRYRTRPLDPSESADPGVAVSIISPGANQQLNVFMRASIYNYQTGYFENAVADSVLITANGANNFGTSGSNAVVK